MRVLYRRNSFDTPGAEGKLCHHWQRRKYRQEESLITQQTFAYLTMLAQVQCFNALLLHLLVRRIFFLFFLGAFLGGLLNSSKWLYLLAETKDRCVLGG